MVAGVPPKVEAAKGMEMATRTVEQEMEALRGDLAKLREDVAALTSAVGDTLTGAVKAKAQKVGAAANGMLGRAEEFAHEAHARGREGVAAVEHQIEAHPLTSVLMAFGLGVLIGKWFDR
jgi:ElaB/YqjD/DUF883 family membrane-anchored ribosome-binding protein